MWQLRTCTLKDSQLLCCNNIFATYTLQHCCTHDFSTCLQTTFTNMFVTYKFQTFASFVFHANRILRNVCILSIPNTVSNLRFPKCLHILLYEMLMTYSSNIFSISTTYHFQHGCSV